MTKRPLECALAAMLVAVAAGCVVRANPDAGHDGGGLDVREAGAVGDAGARLVAIEVAPAEARIVVLDRVPASVSFQVFVVREDGSRTLVEDPVWTIDREDLGTLAEGTFTAHGDVGGSVRINATDPGALGLGIADAVLDVIIERTIDGGPVDAPMRFDTAPVPDDARAPQILYPIDGALLPANVLPPEVQWDGAAPGDTIRVRIERTHARIVGYADAAEATGGLAVPLADWRALLDTDPGDEVSVVVDRYDAAIADVVTSRPIELHVDRSALFGALYTMVVHPADHPEVQVGVFSMEPATGVRRIVVPFPPAAPHWTTQHADCFGCHTLSRDGRYLAGPIDFDLGSAVFDLTDDLTRDPAPVAFDPGLIEFVSASFSPDASRLVIAEHSGVVVADMTSSLSMIDARTGARIPIAGMPIEDAGGPAWSPDGTSIAFVDGGLDGEYIVDQGDLAVASFVAPDVLGPPTLIHAGASLSDAAEGGVADSHVSWSPDGEFVVFQHGPLATSWYTDAGGHTSPGAIYLMRASGGPAVRLDAAMGGADRIDGYQPTFAPFVGVTEDGGTRYWIGFSSRRPYGRYDQGDTVRLWIAAVDGDGEAGEDPSHPPYWLPGQTLYERTYGAQWAPLPCRSRGEICATGSDCCSGSCVAGEDDARRCMPALPEACRTTGQTCEATSDCCAPSLVCSSRVCIESLD